MTVQRGRSPGEIRQALFEAATVLAHERAHTPVPGANWREIAQRATLGEQRGVGWLQAKSTVRNMIRAGDLRPVGELQVLHSRRPMLALAPAAGSAAERTGAQALVSVLQRWRAVHG